MAGCSIRRQQSSDCRCLYSWHCFYANNVISCCPIFSFHSRLRLLGGGSSPDYNSFKLSTLLVLFADGCSNKDSVPDWQMLGEAAAEIARFKGQQQSLHTSQPSNSTTGGSGSTSRPASLRQLKRSIRRAIKRVEDLPGWLLYRYMSNASVSFNALSSVLAILITLGKGAKLCLLLLALVHELDQPPAGSAVVSCSCNG